MGTLLRIVPNKVPTFGMILIFNYKCGAYRTRTDHLNTASVTL